MKKTIITLSAILIITACTSEPTQTAQPSPTPMMSNQPAATIESSLTEQGQAQSTKKLKGYGDASQPVAPLSTNPDFIATEISGRPTDSSVTINVIPASDMDVVITYGIINNRAQAVTATGKANTPQESWLTHQQSCRGVTVDDTFTFAL